MAVRSRCLPSKYVAIFLVWELELVPVCILSALDLGGVAPIRGDKVHSLHSWGSLFILVAALMMAFYGDTLTFDMRSLAAKDYALNFQLWVYAGFLIAYAVKLPIFHYGSQMPTVRRLLPSTCCWLGFS